MWYEACPTCAAHFAAEDAAYSRGASEMREQIVHLCCEDRVFVTPEEGSDIDASKLTSAIWSLPLVPGQAARGTTT